MKSDVRREFITVLILLFFVVSTSFLSDVFERQISVGTVSLYADEDVPTDEEDVIPIKFKKFGGNILMVVPCAFPPSVIQFIGPPSPAAVQVLPFSSIYLYYQFFRPGPKVLGQYITIEGVSFGCAFPPLPAQGAVFQEGTSLLP